MFDQTFPFAEPALPPSDEPGEQRRERLSLRERPFSPAVYSIEPAIDQRQATIAGLRIGNGGSPRTVVAGDFDEDGVPDVVIGVSEGTEHSLLLLRGNFDAIYPHDPSTRARRAAGAALKQPFLLSDASFAINTAPDLLGSGDFDNDGHLDVVVGTLGRGSLAIWAGDGRGDFVFASERTLPGGLTSLLVGDVNRRDGLADIVVGVASSDGASVVVFEGAQGAQRAEPETFSMPSAPRALALVRPDGESFVGLAVGAGSELLVIHGRDRRLVQGESRRASAPAARVDRVKLDSAVVSIAWGDFAWEPIRRGELAVLTEDGAVRLFSRRVAPDDAQPSPRTPAVEWAELGRRDVLRGPSETLGASARPSLLALRMSGSGTQDLAVLEDGRGRLHLARGLERVDSSDLAAASERLDSSGAFDEVDLGPGVVAALPMRLDTDALSDLLVLREDSAAPLAAITAPLAAITVNTAVDNVVGGDGLCTLREAITNANSNTDGTAGDCAAGAPGSDTILFAIAGGGSTATITPASPLPAITDPLTIDGTSQGCASPPCIELDGSLAGTGVSGLALSSDANVVRGLAINSFQATGAAAAVDLNGSDGNVIEGNHIGTDLTGTVGLGNGGPGIRLDLGSSGNTVGGSVPAARNVISGSTGGGVALYASASDNLVLGNYIGTDGGGTFAIPNTVSGVFIFQSSGNTVGGSAIGEGNLLSGNVLDGVLINTGNANLVLGNYVGTDAGGKVAVPNGSYGVRIGGGDDNTIGGTGPGAGNLVSGNDGDGIMIFANQSDLATGNQVLGNLVGTDSAGTVALGNTGPGIRILRTPESVVGGTPPEARNVISGNGSDGVFINGVGADRNELLGNFIGTDITGTAAIPNTWVGVEFQDGIDNVLGGADPGAGNLISGNGTSGSAVNDSGVLVDVGTSNLRILGNRIGTDVTGAFDLGNGGVGVSVLGASGNFIGGELPGEGNLISGNGSRGIYITCQGSPCTGGAANTLSGNLVGTDASGSFAIPNAGGVLITTDSAIDNVIGGTAPGARNVISGNTADGVFILSAQNQVIGNYIGTDTSGTHDLGNSAAGVEIERASGNRIEANVISGNAAMGVLLQSTAVGPATNNLIVGNLVGTDASGRWPIGNDSEGVVVLGATDNRVDGNLIAYNGLSGVAVYPGTIAPSAGPATGNALSANQILSNGQLGIDLWPDQSGSDGVTPNDANDPDTGANLLQNFPDLTLADATPVDALVEGTLDSVPLTDFRIEFFASTACDGSHGQGERYLGFTDVTTNGAGDRSFSVALPPWIADGDAITATATDPAGNTSEFSACFTATCSGLVPFAQTMLAPDKNTLAWPDPANVRFAAGSLDSVSTYGTIMSGTLPDTTFLDIAADLPTPGSGLYYVVKPLGCGSWQTVLGAANETGRDPGLP